MVIILSCFVAKEKPKSEIDGLDWVVGGGARPGTVICTSLWGALTVL
jgi:hypothetical protein